MSRSYRKFHDGYLFHSVTVSGFNKGIHKDKKDNNRRLRRKANILLRYYDDGRIKCHKDDVEEDYWKLIGK